MVRALYRMVNIKRNAKCSHENPVTAGSTVSVSRTMKSVS